MAKGVYRVTYTRCWASGGISRDQSVIGGGDVNGDGMVDLADLIQFNLEWQPGIGTQCP